MSTTSVLDGPDEDAYKQQANQQSQDGDAYKPPSTSFDQPLSQEWHDSVVEGLNLLQLGWHAEAYSRYVGMTGKQMLKSAGIQRKIMKNARATMAPAFLGLTS